MAATTCGISANDSIEALESFNGVRRRLEYKGEHSGVKIYDDFAHHPTAITYASEAIRNEFKENKILGIIELGSNTMSSGYHGNAIFDSVTAFDKVIWLDRNKVIKDDESFNHHDECIGNIKSIIKDYDVVLLMTNKDSSKLYEPIIDFLIMKNNLPVFPLGLVALPGSIQSLQIFEPRYLKMIKKCMSDSHGFVIVLKINDASEYGISKKGTYVEIVDFNNLPNGLLGITVKAETKVSINNICQLEDGLHIADIKPEIDPEVDNQALLAEYPDIINILSQIIKHPKVNELPIKVDFNSADSVAYHLAGLIPLTSIQKQNLLEAFDATQRLSILSKYIEKISSL